METPTGGDEEKLFKATNSRVDCRKFREVLTCADDWDKKSKITKYKVLSITRSGSPLNPVLSCNQCVHYNSTLNSIQLYFRIWLRRFYILHICTAQGV